MKKLFFVILILICGKCFAFAAIDDVVKTRLEIVEIIVHENELDTAILNRPYVAAYVDRNWAIISKDSIGYSIYGVEYLSAKDKMLYKISYNNTIEVLEWFFSNSELNNIVPELKPCRKFNAYDYYIINNDKSQPFVFNIEDTFSGTPTNEFDDKIQMLSNITVWLSCPYLRPYMENPFAK